MHRRRLSSAIFADNNNEQCADLPLQPISSRRRWLTDVVMGVTTTSVLAAAAVPSPALAAKVATPTAAICDSTVSVWERNGRIIYLLGTAHISDISAQLAGQLVRDTHPDAVFVELDLKRVAGTGTMAKRMEASAQANSLSITSTGDDGESKPTRVLISPVGRATATPSLPAASAGGAESTSATIATTGPPLAPAPEKQSRGGFLQGLGAAAVGKGIKSLYRKLGDEGFNPGEEFVAAIREGQKQGAAVVLGDQDVDVTLRRMSQAFQQTDLKRLLSSDSTLEQSMRQMAPGGGTTPPLDGSMKSELTAYVETIKTKENVKQIMDIMKQEAPAIYQVMVTERDVYMAAGLNTLDEFAIITAVMGLAHIDGVESNLRKEGWRAVPLRCPVQA